MAYAKCVRLGLMQALDACMSFAEVASGRYTRTGPWLARTGYVRLVLMPMRDACAPLIGTLTSIACLGSCSMLVRGACAHIAGTQISHVLGPSLGTRISLDQAQLLNQKCEQTWPQSIQVNFEPSS